MNADCSSYKLAMLKVSVAQKPSIITRNIQVATSDNYVQTTS